MSLQALSWLLKMLITFWYNTYSVIEEFSFSTNFPEKNSGLWGFVFNYIFPTVFNQKLDLIFLLWIFVLPTQFNLNYCSGQKIDSCTSYQFLLIQLQFIFMIFHYSLKIIVCLLAFHLLSNKAIKQDIKKKPSGKF